MRSAKHHHLLRADISRLRRAAALSFLLVAACASASAQAPAVAPAPAAAPTPSTAQTGATADEDFELNIDTRRISEKDFQAETEVEAGGAGGLHLKVGAALRASDIELVLTGVRGRVRFRASLARLQRLFEARRAGSGAATQTTTPAP